MRFTHSVYIARCPRSVCPFNWCSREFAMPSRRSLPLLLAAILMLAPAAAGAGESHVTKPGPHLYLAGAGLMLLAGGGAVAYYQNRAADRDMDVYRGSAFTGN